MHEGILNIEKGKIKISRNIVFNENNFYYKRHYNTINKYKEWWLQQNNWYCRR